MKVRVVEIGANVWLRTAIVLTMTCAFTFGEDDKKSELFISSASNLVNGIVISELSVDENIEILESEVENLNSIYIEATLKYKRSRKRARSPRTPILDGVGDDLEKVRLMLDLQLRREILKQRLIKLDEQQSMLHGSLLDKPRICEDLDDVITKLKIAKKVEFVEYPYSEREKSIGVGDGDVAKKIAQIFSSKHVSYDPRESADLHGSSTGGFSNYATLFIDDTFYVNLLGEFIVNCENKSYTADSDVELNIYKETEGAFAKTPID